MKKIFMIIGISTIIICMVMINVSNVNSVTTSDTFEGIGSSGGSLTSNPCGESRTCMNLLPYFGIKVTIVKKNNNSLKSITKPIYVWNNVNESNELNYAIKFIVENKYVSDDPGIAQYLYKECYNAKIVDSIKVSNYIKKHSISSSGPNYNIFNYNDTNSDDEKARNVSSWDEMKSKLLNGNSHLQSLLKIIAENKLFNDGYSLDSVEGMLIKIEPINVFQEKNGESCLFYVGSMGDIHSGYTGSDSVLNDFFSPKVGYWRVYHNRIISYYVTNSDFNSIGYNGITGYEGETGIEDNYSKAVETYNNNGYAKTGLGVAYIKISSQYIPGKLQIKKIDGINNPIANVHFDLYKGLCTDGKLIKQDIVTSGEGLATVENLESGKYCIKETQAPYGYKKSDLEKIVYITAGETNSVEFKNFKYPALKIYKYKAGTKKALSGAEFTVYAGNCENKGARIDRGSTNEDGFLQFMLNKRGAYCVEETQAPNNYINSNSSKNVYLKFGDDITLEFENELDCKGEFEQAKVNGEVSMQDRIKIFWGKYSIDGKGRRYNQLLNLTNKDATSACQYKKPTYTPQITCFNFKYPSNSEFNANNLSNYNEQFFSNDGYINFCLTTTNIYTEKKLPSDKIKVKAGMIVFDDKLQLKVVKTCYKYQYDSASSASNSGFNYTLNDVWINKYRTSFTENIINNVRINKLITDYEYINEDKINYLKDIPNGSKSISDKDENNNLIKSEDDGKITYEYTYKYEYTPISLLYGSGKNIASKGKYSNNFNVPGIISTFSESGSQIIKFGVKYKDYTDNKDIYINTEDDDDNCKYTVDQAIITGSNLLNLQFEQVNLKNPFIEKNNNPTTGNVTIRKVGSNWRSIDINSFDLNGDGVRNEIDEAIKKYVNDFIKNPLASENGDNYLVKYVMNGRPNSYSKDKPKYVITLTPSDIKAIRNYNDSNDYQDYEKVYCTDSNNVLCSTDFIDNLKTTDPKVCVGDTCEKLSSGINFKREVTGGSDVKDASYIKFSLSNSDYGKIEGDMNIVVKKGDKIEFPELNIKEGYGLLGWITKNENNRFNYNNYIDISNVTATLGTQEYMAVLAKEHKIYRETDGNNSYVCTVLSRKSMQESGCPRLADPSNASGFEGWKYNNRVIDNYYTRKFITDNDDFIITFTPSYTQIKIYESIEVVMNNTKIRYSKRGVDIVSKIDKIIGTYSMNGKIFSEPINKNQCEYDGDVHSTRLGKNAFRARCKRIYSKYIDYEIVKVPLDYIDTNKNALGAGIFTIYTNSNYENEISEAYIKDSENNTHKFERTHLGLRIDLKEFVPGKYPVGDYWFDLVFKGKNEDLITCKFKVTKTKLGLIPKRDVIICPEYQ